MVIVGCIATPAQPAELLAVRLGPFERSLPVADLRQYVENQQESGKLKGFLRFVSEADRRSLQQALQTKIPLDRVAIDRVLNQPAGIQLLSQVALAVQGDNLAEVQALRSAVILGIKPEGFSGLSFLEAYPLQRLTVNLPETFQIINKFSPKPPTDTLSSNPFWQTWVDYQAITSQKQHPKTCLFGDSISAALGNSLGEKTYNFAIGGMSSVSLVNQLNYLAAHSVTCPGVVIAIGTNDAWYTIQDDEFVQNLRMALSLTRQLGANQIVLIPAFYSTLAASKNPGLAGSIARVERINHLIAKVADEEGVSVDAAAIQPLFDGQTLKQALTIDGVHLNHDGIMLYRQSLLKSLNQVP
ncbi:alpha/beta hydrolase [Kovacikia minuta CCNUW1]|uniref:alpha/beta hydrolase n=1 Tax=Kovacikia minuta TaxID=2931930 RepID=UPI001CC93A50|nr:alpha/beta hydrolase [Kovacikia minuta]UBF24384.1 alpha/beta hydrolase [Kovacikia minuta CCNUW1]